MEIRLHALYGMHFIISGAHHYDQPIRKRSFSSAHKNTKTIAQRLQKCPLTVKSVFEKMRLQMPPPLKNRGEKLSLLSLSPIFFEGRGASVSLTDVFTGYMWKVGQIGEKNIPLQTKVYTWGKGRIKSSFSLGRIYAPLLFALNNTNSHSSIVSFLPALSQLKLA